MKRIVVLGAVLGTLLTCVAQNGAPAQKTPAMEPKAAVNETTIQLHYLGHASFILQFDNGVSILTDYGTSNSYGLDSPIYEIGDFKPSVVIYSHKDPDHYRDAKFDGAHVLTGSDALSIEGVDIRPVRTTERSPSDNSSYIITYKGFTIVPLGDAQGDISTIAVEEVQKRTRAIFPARIDLLFMPVGWTQTITNEAEEYVNVLQPRRVVPMHYWGRTQKLDFLARLRQQNSSVNRHYKIREINGADCKLHLLQSDDQNATEVISLEPASFK